MMMKQSDRYSQRPPLVQIARPAWVLLLASSVVLSALPANSQSLDPTVPKAMQGQISISRDVNATPSKELVSINLRNADLSDVLNTLAQQGGFNLILDPSVTGKLTVDLKNISINKALEYIFTVADLGYSRDGNTVIVASKVEANLKNLNAKTLKAIPVQYKDASTIAKTLNDTIFKVYRPGGSSTALASYDAGSNSILVLGTDSDIKLVNQALRELDVPRNRKVYSIRHSTPAYVASVLAANFFQPASSGSQNGNNTSGSGASNLSMGANSGASIGASPGSGGSSSGMSTGSSSPGTTGSSNGTTGSSSATTTGNGTTGTSGTTGGSSTTGMTSGLTNFTAGGVTFIAEPISATLTVLATDSQLKLIDSIISHVDVKRPQAEIEVSLVEIQNSDLKSFRPLYGQMLLGKETGLTINQLDGAGNPTGANLFTFNRANLTSLVPRNLNPISTLNIRQSTQNIKGKILANPTIIAMDGQTSNITITDQVPSISQIATTNGVAAPVVTTSITTQDAGITLQLTPTITNDGSITLNLQPDVSQPSRTVSAGTVSTVLISKRTLSLNAVRVHDGETLVIGGLLRETSQLDINRVPGLDKLPIISAMFRAVNSNNRDKTELVLMVTPHILREDAVTYFDAGNGSAPNAQAASSAANINQTRGFVPVSLPRFNGVEAVKEKEREQQEAHESSSQRQYIAPTNTDNGRIPLRNSSVSP
jgi:general secretion pathway protein D